jgi:catechol 2,3-dioxygenase-like lactoylglutathione lyase family enzyme
MSTRAADSLAAPAPADRSQRRPARAECLRPGPYCPDRSAHASASPVCDTELPIRVRGCSGSESARQSEDRPRSIRLERTGSVIAEFPAIAHVAVTITDLDRSRIWYQRLFGADPVLDEDTGHTTTLCGSLAARRSAFTSRPTHRLRSRSMNCGRGLTTSRLAVRSPAGSGQERHPHHLGAGQAAVRGGHRAVPADSVARRHERAGFNGNGPMYLAPDSQASRCRP